MDTLAAIAVIAIGRNEGARLVCCLASAQADGRQLVYVDSGSTDDSLNVARAAGAIVVELDLSRPFTAARARNAGFAALKEKGTLPAYLQFVDGDCELQPDWIDKAVTFLDTHPEVAVVCGRRRERFPEASIYNALCDAEWDTPVGQAKACGGDALMRWNAFDAVGGFNPNLIAGEELELGVRIRAAGWEIWRIDTEMTLHDAAITRFGQWWTRTRRSGHANAEGMAMHGAAPERHRVHAVRRSLTWGMALPLVILASALLTPWALIGFLAYPAQVARIALREGGTRARWIQAFLLTLGKFPETQGFLGYWFARLTGKRRRLIEYK